MEFVNLLAEVSKDALGLVKMILERSPSLADLPDEVRAVAEKNKKRSYAVSNFHL